MISLLAWLSFILALLSYFSGAAATYRGKAHPSIISRFFWLCLSVTNLLSYMHLGAGSGMFLATAGTMGSLMIFSLSLRFGYLEFKRSDIITIIGAVSAFCCYIFLDIKFLALAAGLLTHFISGVPTYKKVWREPYSEDLTFWLLFAIASALSLIGVILQNKNLVYPLYFMLFDSGMTLLLVIQRQRNKLLPATELSQ